MWDDLKGVIGNVAPSIATALGGPLAGGAVKLLTSALGLSNDAKPKDIMAAVTHADPETIARIKEAELDFQKRMAELEVDLEKISAQDRDSARKREQAVGGWANPVLAGLVIGGFFAAVWAVLGGYVVADTVNAGMIGTLVGYVSAKADQVVSYYFGSSHGSRSKDGILANLKR